jgi:hypothetical protein
MSGKPVLHLGSWRRLNGAAGGVLLRLPAHHLVTHAVISGMTGSGKSGLVTVLAEEALSAGIPTIVIDVKGDLPNLLLNFPSFDPAHYEPWVEASAESGASRASAAVLAAERRDGLAAWSLDEGHVARFSQSTHLRVITPGSTAGESLHVLSSLERRSSRWDADPESARAALSAAVSLVLRLLGRDPDPAKSKEHVLLSVLAERRLLAGDNAELGALMQDLQTPPIDEVGALRIDTFFKRTERLNLAAALNTLLASPTFATWRQGAGLDIGEWTGKRGTRTPGVILSVAHLDDEERALVLGVVLEEFLSWVRSLRGSQQLRALLIFDEVYGFLPPHPANPPTKRPLVALMKQARAFGVGVVVATQNPMDIDYRALSNAGLWCIGRLQTDADRERVIDGLSASLSDQETAAELDRTVSRLSNRWFVVRNAHAASAPILLQPRYAMSWLRGPMTRTELRAAREQRSAWQGDEIPKQPEKVQVTAEASRPQGADAVITVEATENTSC